LVICCQSKHDRFVIRLRSGRVVRDLDSDFSFFLSVDAAEACSERVVSEFEINVGCFENGGGIETAKA
jgi:hypothetical protein